LAAAVRLVDLGAEVVLLEATTRVGGLAGTIELDGLRADMGPHIFAGGAPSSAAMWTRFLGDGFHQVRLRRGILGPHGLLDHPPRAAELLRALPLRTIAPAAVAFARTRLTGRRSDSQSAEQWVSDRYGRPLYDLVLRDYVEKLWGRSGREVHADFARSLFGEASRIRKREALRSQIFLYPRHGSSSVWNRMADHVRSSGRVRLGSPVTRLTRVDERISVEAGESYDVDAVISTMPLTRLAELVQPSAVPIGTLTVRHAIIVHFAVDGPAHLQRTWVFVADRGLAVGRITDSREWTGTSGRGVVALEFWCGDDDAIWKLDDASVLDVARAELGRTALLPGNHVGSGRVTRLRGALPVPTLDAPAVSAKLRELVGACPGLFTIGRHGSFSFNSMAESMAEGIAAADAAMR
jgi:protoporphyrinogen oxidase